MMNQGPDAGGVLAWILGCISVGGALYAIGRRIFSTVTREELGKIIEGQDRKFLDALNRQGKEFELAIKDGRDERLRLHGENRESAHDTFDRLSDVERGLARVEGQLNEQRLRPTR